MKNKDRYKYKINFKYILNNNIVKYFVLVLSIFFMFNIDVFAEEEFSKVECFYSTYGIVNDNKTFIYGIDTPAVLSAKLIYDAGSGEKPKIDYVLSTKSDYEKAGMNSLRGRTDDKFSKINSFFSSRDSKGIRTITDSYFACLGNISNEANEVCFSSVVKTIDLSALKSDEGRFVCPNLYIIHDQYEYDNNTIFVSTYKVSLKSESGSSTLNPIVENVIQGDSTIVVEKDDDGNVTKKKETSTCKYLYYNNKGVIGGVCFSIFDNGTVDNYSGTGDLNQDMSASARTFVLMNDLPKNNGKYTCPEYIDIKLPWLIGSANVELTSYTSEPPSWNGKYTGPCNSVDDNAFDISKNIIATYVKINDKTSRIYIANKNEKIVAYQNQIEFSINNMSSYLSKLQKNDEEKSDADSNSKPHFIIYNLTDKTYNFSDTLATGSEVVNYKLEDYILPSLDGYNFEATCENVFGDSFMKFLTDNVFKIIYIIVPVILIVLTSIDFAKVIFSDDKDGIKKATSRFGKRLVVSVLIYLVPILFSTIAKILGNDDIQKCSDYLQQCLKSKSEDKCVEDVKRNNKTNYMEK